MQGFNEITPHLFISNWYVSNDINFIQSKNIRAVITLEKTPTPQNIVDYYRNHNIDFMYIPINDSENENIYQYFDTTFEFINKHIDRGENVLVHCAAGISRSATIIIHYIIRKFFQNDDLRNVNSLEFLNYIINEIRTIRAINPNRGFTQQLFSAIETYKTMYR
jgi:protein-tyrosine phosphatase